MMYERNNRVKSPDGLDHLTHLQIMHTWAAFAVEHNNVAQIFDYAAAERIKLWTDEMLRDYRPRLMTLKEVQNVRYRPVWIETRDEQIQCWAVPMRHVKGFGDPGIIDIAWFGEQGTEEFRAAEYGETWRCWTDEPTDKQSEQTMWKDGQSGQAVRRD